MSNEFQIDLNYVKGDQNSNTGDRANAGVSFELSPRVNVKTGLGIPLSKTENTDTNNYLSGEGSIEYDISKKNDGTLILRGYSKPTYRYGNRTQCKRLSKSGIWSRGCLE
jgi:hypothetical protein